jgi:hypothetical protein
MKPHFLYIGSKIFLLFKNIMLIYNKYIFVGMISKPYNIQGTNTIKLITIGNKTVQQ